MRTRTSLARLDDLPPQRREVVQARRGTGVRPAADRPRRPSRGLRDHHGTFGSGQVDAPRHPGAARCRLERRVRAVRRAGREDVAQATGRARQAHRRIRLPAVPPARRPDGGGEPGGAALLPRHEAFRAAGSGGGRARSVQHRGKEGPLPEPALRWTAAARRHRPRGDRPAPAPPRGRADGKPALGPGRRDHEAVQIPQRTRDDDRAGHPFGQKRRIWEPHRSSAGRLDRALTEAVKELVRVLVADDQPDVVEALRLLLRREGFDLSAASSPAGVLSALGAQDFDAALVDLNYTRDTTSGKEGLDLLSQVRGLDSELPVIVMTAWGSVEGAVEAMRRGARDYVQKPWDNARLVATLRTQVELGKALRRSRRLEEENTRLRGGAPRLFASSPAMQPVLRLLERVGPSDANVLVTGEHGTGKEVVARFLHDSSKRAGQPLVPVNAGGLSEGVFESELFGHVRGAFTDAKNDRAGAFEVADGGTLFLDEVGNMPLPQQAKLLRVLQTGEFNPVGSSKVKRGDVRVIAATNARLHDEVAQGRFREDLLYRLNTVEVQLPPLRDRLEDIPHLAQFFLRRIVARGATPARRFSADALDALVRHPWRGNVRELEHAVERAVLLAPGEEIGPEDLFLGATAQGPALIERMTLDDAERHLISRALSRCGGDGRGAARGLGGSPPPLPPP